MSLTADTAAAILDHPPASADGSDRFPELAARLRDGEKLLFKDGPHHLTASYLVFDPTLEHVLLQFHAKGRFWVQFGGHLEPADGSFLAAAERELAEESGLRDVTLVPGGPFDIQAQELSARFGRCLVHFDLLYAGRTPRDARPTLNDESHAIEWFAVDDLPPECAPGLPSRVLRTQAAIIDAGDG